MTKVTEDAINVLHAMRSTLGEITDNMRHVLLSISGQKDAMLCTLTIVTLQEADCEDREAAEIIALNLDNGLSSEVSKLEIVYTTSHDAIQDIDREAIVLFSRRPPLEEGED